MISKSFLGKTFNRNGKSFKVIAIDSYPNDRVSEQHLEILTLPKGVLVAVPYRGTLIPNITLGKQGVVRLTAVEIGGKIYSRPGKISEALEITQAYRAYKISAA